MTVTTRLRFLRVAMILIGLIFIVGVYVSAVWMALESQSDSVRADDLGNLCDPWRLPLDCFSQSSSPSKSDLVHGCLEHRARGNHDRSSSNHAV